MKIKEIIILCGYQRRVHDCRLKSACGCEAKNERTECRRGECTRTVIGKEALAEMASRLPSRVEATERKENPSTHSIALRRIRYTPS